MKTLYLLALVLAIACSTANAADAYKCKLQNGSTVFQDSPCLSAGATISSARDVQPQRTPEELQEIRNRYARQLQAPRIEAPAAPVAARPQADASQSSECRDAKMSYENEASSIKNNHALIDSAKRMMYAACGIAAPAEVTVRNTTIVNNPPPSRAPRPINCYQQGNRTFCD